VFRKPKHDFGPVRGIVSDWVRKSYAAKKGVDKAGQSAGQKGQKEQKAKKAKKAKK